MDAGRQACLYQGWRYLPGRSRWVESTQIAFHGRPRLPHAFLSRWYALAVLPRYDKCSPSYPGEHLGGTRRWHGPSSDSDGTGGLFRPLLRRMVARRALLFLSDVSRRRAQDLGFNGASPFLDQIP